MNKRLITLITGFAIAGAASAAIHVDEAFNYPDGPVLDLALHTGAGLDGMFTDEGASWYDITANIESGKFTGQSGPAVALLLNPSSHVVGDEYDVDQVADMVAMTVGYQHTINVA